MRLICFFAGFIFCVMIIIAYIYVKHIKLKKYKILQSNPSVEFIDKVIEDDKSVSFFYSSGQFVLKISSEYTLLIDKTPLIINPGIEVYLVIFKSRRASSTAYYIEANLVRELCLKKFLFNE